MKIYRIRSLEEYQKLKKETSAEDQMVRDLEASYERTGKPVFTARSYSYPAQQQVDFRVDYQDSFGGGSIGVSESSAQSPI